MHEYAIVCQNLTKSFGRATVVDNVSFTLRPGRILALLGPSGCGKTTTLRLIAGFEELDGGRIEIAGQPVADGRIQVPPEKRRVGMVFQDYAIFPHLSVAQNIAFGLGRGPDAESRTRAMLDMVGLQEMETHMPHELSGGQQQRIALARALALNPAVVLLDEPFSNLDAALRTQVRQEVRELLHKNRATAVFVTHDQEEALVLGDEIALMNAGKIEQIGTPQTVFHRPKTRFVAEFMGQTDFVPGEVTARGVATPLGMLPQPINAAPGTAVSVAVRPDDVRLHAANGETPVNGRILSRQFLGIAYVYRIALEEGTIVHSWQPHAVDIAPGTAVRASLDTTQRFTCFMGETAVG